MLVDAFADLIEADPRAFRHKFRKMAADPFAFYRGSAPLFYADMARLEDPWADERTSRVWIQGDLHAENFGTYMDSAGVLVFDVNDFDEAYLGPLHVGPAADGGVAGAARASPRRSRTSAIARLIETYARGVPRAGARVLDGERRREFRLDAGQHRRARCTRCCSGAAGDARGTARRDHRRSRATTGRFAAGAGVRRLEDDERDGGLAAYEDYLETIPRPSASTASSYAVKDVVGRAGFGIGSRRAARLQPAGRGAHAGARERRRALDEAGADVPAVGRVVDDERIRDYFEHQGHRTGGLAAGAAGARRPVAGLVRAATASARWSRRSRPTRPTSTGTT